MKMNKKIILLAALLLSVLTRAGDLSVDNLTVTKDAAVYGKLDFYSIAGSTNTNGVVATGGTMTTNGNYLVHTFTNNGTFEVLGGASVTCDVLIVAGGGGGGGYYGAGGGGGGVIYTNLNISGSSNVTVGGGGVGGDPTSWVGKNGTNSTFSTLTAIGGGGGGYPGVSGVAGGSGGGAGGWGGSYGSGTAGQGYNGGNTGNNAPGGGGGGSEVGQDGSSGQAGHGGEGSSSGISGSSYKYGAGGGGGGWVGNAVYAVGGADGGGAGSTAGDGSPGVANSGGGGGGGGHNGGYNQHGGHGGSGIVRVRYSTSSSGSSYVSNLTVSVSSNGINQADASGSNIFMGKVGIGTNNPAEKLHVAGNVQVDGTNIVSAITLGGETRTTWPTGNLSSSNNLSDITDQAAARTNLGLGSAATNDASAFLAPSGDGSQLSGITATQVGALSTNAGALIAANNLSDVANAGTARSNLGLGTAATNAASAFLTPTGNGSQLTGITPAQTGSLSTNGGVVNGTVSLVTPAGDIPMGVYTNQ